jgi:hypothetical protein
MLDVWHGGIIAPPLLLVVVLASSCRRFDTPSIERNRTPKVVTTIGRIVVRFEHEQRRVEELDRQRMANGGPPTIPPDLSPAKLRAAARGRFAQISWSARFPHGQRATPTVSVGDRIIRCAIELTGTPEPNAGTDWAAYLTTIDQLPAGTYRLLAPLDEKTLRVPETFVP